MKRLLFKATILTVISIAPLLAYNFIVDPYSVLRKDYKSMYICPNERFAKTDYILNNPGKFDSFVFGSSRVSQIPVQVVNKMTDMKFYNMTYIAGVTDEHLDTIRLFINNGVTVKNLVIGLDIFSFRSGKLESMRSKSYPKAFFEKIIFYHDYLTLEPDSSMLMEVKFDGDEARYDFYETGCYHFLRKEKKLQLKLEKHNLRFPPVPRLCKDQSEEALGNLKEIAVLCREKNINLYIFMNPIHVAQYLCEDIEFLNSVRLKLAYISEYWDFSGINEVVTDNYNYYDISHYHMDIGKMIITKILNLPGNAPADFGRKVTLDNVGAHVKEMKKEFLEEKARYGFKCGKCSGEK